MKHLLLIFALASAAIAQTRQVGVAWSSTATAPAGVTVTHEIDRAAVSTGASCPTATGYSRIGTVPLATREFTDNAPLGTHCYRVSSVATAGVFSSRSTYAYSSVVDVTLPAPPAPSAVSTVLQELIASMIFQLDGKELARTMIPIRVRAE